jgi:hypothetical protein
LGICGGAKAASTTRVFDDKIIHAAGHVRAAFFVRV